MGNQGMSTVLAVIKIKIYNGFNDHFNSTTTCCASLPNQPQNAIVNLACHLVNDAWAGRFDAAVVISNDTDLVEPIRIVTQELKKDVLLLCTSQFGASKPLVNVATLVLHVHASHYKAAQFPDLIPGTTIEKPQSW